MVKTGRTDKTQEGKGGRCIQTARGRGKGHPFKRCFQAPESGAGALITTARKFFLIKAIYPHPVTLAGMDRGVRARHHKYSANTGGGQRYSRSLPWMIWKFFTEACVTRPWKLSTYDCVSSFQTGVLFCNSMMVSVFLFCQRASRVSCSWRQASGDSLT